ncbi:MAG: ribosome biogenesis GTPase Der, partial [Mycobacteriales bacterium]
VHPEAGVTRDRKALECEWNGVRFELIDTGGVDFDAGDSLSRAVQAQARAAIADADAVAIVLDARAGLRQGDAEVAEILRRANTPVVVVANKVDSERAESDVARLWSLGLGEPHPVSALHGRGSGDVLDAICAALPEATEILTPPDGPRRVALIGKPNVGKSSLLNRLAREERVVVDSVAGTTVDPVDTVLELGGQSWQFVDTAGLRRKVRSASGTEYYASVRTAAAIDSAEVVVVLLDAAQTISDQDSRVLSMVADAGRALVVAFNKWDLVDDDRRLQLEKEIERELGKAQWAPRINLSARTGRAVDKLAPVLRTALRGWDNRLTTGALNTWLKEIVAAHPHPMRGGRQPRILFATQADIRPPRFVLFTTGFLEESYRRFLQRRLREDFDFAGTPIDIAMKIREKRGPKA